jgi:hypothetical protein
MVVMCVISNSLRELSGPIVVVRSLGVTLPFKLNDDFTGVV